MTILALLSWIVLGGVIGGVFAASWKVRGLTLAWGVAAGSVGGVVGGLVARTVLPGTTSDGVTIVAAFVGAVLAVFIARVRVTRQRTGTA